MERKLMKLKLYSGFGAFRCKSFQMIKKLANSINNGLFWTRRG